MFVSASSSASRILLWELEAITMRTEVFSMCVPTFMKFDKQGCLKDDDLILVEEQMGFPPKLDL